jgi:hypothetical protein
VARSTLPVGPAELVPDLRRMSPETPEVPAFAVWKRRAPEVERGEAPAVRTIVPPVALVLSPAFISRLAPAPDPLPPTWTSILPALVAAAAPVATRTSPEEDRLSVVSPDPMLTPPETPAAPPLAVCRRICPDVDPTEEPEVTSTCEGSE